jgi:hypothetical protein
MIPHGHVQYLLHLWKDATDHREKIFLRVAFFFLVKNTADSFR